MAGIVILSVNICKYPAKRIYSQLGARVAQVSPVSGFESPEGNPIRREVTVTQGSSPRALARVFKALADETRPEVCVCHFERALEIGQSKASRHLRYLLNAGLLQDRREGVWMHYRLADDMGAARLLIVDAVRQNLDPELLADLRSRLESSLCAAPVVTGSCCPAVPPEI
jgi:ArsR family transcriptional regulator